MRITDLGKVGALFLAVTVLATSANAQVLTMVGKIRNVRGGGANAKATLQHPGQSAEDVVRNAPLYPGDIIEVTGGAVVTVSMQAAPIGPTAQKYKVPERSRSLFTAFDDTFLQPFLWLITGDKPDPAYYPKAKGPNDRPASPIVASLLLPEGVQYLPDSQSSATFLWEKGRATLRVASGGMDEVDSTPLSFATMQFPNGPNDISAVGETSALHWRIQRRNAIPSPPWQSTIGDSRSPEQRLVRAVWLLRDGPQEWRLFALSELSDLSQSGSYAADQLWAAAVGGSLAFDQRTP
jgi:hypothetical protein